MSKLNKTRKMNDGLGKAKSRHDSRLARFENTTARKGDETNHQHHKPGSMNMKKSGR